MLTKHVLSYADNIVGSRQKKHQHPMLTPTGDNCGDPFLQPGILTSNAWDRSQNFWKPFNRECPPYRQYLQDVIDRDPLPFLHNKTLLMIGDSVDRNNLRFFCELVGSWDTRVTTMANLSEVFVGDTALHPWNTDPKDLTRPRICRVEEYDFEIINFFHYGLQDEETWTEKEVYTAPGVLEQRIPLLKQLFEDYGRSPDMIILASGRPFSWQADRRSLGFSRLYQRRCVRSCSSGQSSRTRADRTLDRARRDVRRYGYGNVSRRIYRVAHIALLCRMPSLVI